MPAPPPPFRGLSPYTESDDDAESFFGRDAEIEIAAANLLAARLTLLYGPSGVGKTSLVRAGLVHRLRRTPEPLPDSGRRRQAVIVLSEWRTDPIAELAHHARRHAGPSEGGRPTASGAARAMTPTDALRPLADAGDAELLLVFDQFDEYLTSHPRGGPLEEVLPALLRMHDLPVRVLISLREDALAGLDRFKGDIPGLFDNYLRLDHLDRDAAREAIERPIERYNARASDPIVLERGLAGDVLDELAAGDVNIVRRGAPVTSSGRDGSDRIEPAYLQLVMTRLWETELHSGSAELRRSTLAELGGAGRIVQTHLRSTMDALTTRERRLAFQLLHLLVTPSGMKVRHTPRDLADYVAAPESTGCS
jgi:hypothetical protein